ncbi:SGNH/GDSL hydrolase family protein [Streptomyces sp. NPDC002143]
MGGHGLRIRLSNAFGDRPITFGQVYAGVQQSGATIAPGTQRRLHFGASPQVTIAPGEFVYSDPLHGAVAPQANLVVSLFVSSASGTLTGHQMAKQTSYIAPAGDHAAEEAATSYTQHTTAWFYLDSVVMEARHGTGAVVALGDSITDGHGATPDSNRRWPDYLARRLLSHPSSRLKGVANEGIAGNKLLTDWSGQSALKRLDRDVLSQPGVQTVILLEGINDIKATPAPTAADVIAGYMQIVTRAHDQGKCVVGGTITPYQGWPQWSQAGEDLRLTVNSFIRTSEAFDAVVDFDKAVQDPATPARLFSPYDSGDHLHPNDAGLKAMADAVDLHSLRCAQRRPQLDSEAPTARQASSGNGSFSVPATIF